MYRCFINTDGETKKGGGELRRTIKYFLRCLATTLSKILATNGIFRDLHCYDEKGQALTLFYMAAYLK